MSPRTKRGGATPKRGGSSKGSPRPSVPPRPAKSLEEGRQSPLWQFSVDLKLQRIGKSLSDPDDNTEGYVFSLYRQHLVRLLDWIRNGLPKPQAEQDRHNLLHALDKLALYLRFYESAVAARTPHPLIEHALDLFARLESDATILLRPQNDQTFETSTRSYSLQEQLAEIVLDATGPARGPNPFVKDLRRLPNIYIISYPKYYDDVFLLYPLLGHEIGHVVAEIRQLFLRANQEARGLLGNLGLDEFELRSAQTLAANWAQEFYCDLVGKALYGEPYIFALHLMLLPYPRAFRMCSFEEYVRTSYQSTKALVDLLKGDPATIAGDHDGGSARKAPEPRATLQYPVAAGRGPKGVGITHQTGEPGWHSDQLFRIYPSPGQRLRLLEEEHRPSRQAPGSSQFRSWRRKLRSEALSFSEKFESPIYSAILNAAKAIAKRLSANTIEGRPAGFLPGPHTAQLQQLVEKLRNRIPPCEWRSQSGALQPGDWQTALHAGWIVFLENTLASDGRRSKDWAFEYLEFVYDSLDMLGLARTYKSAAVGLPARER